MKTKRYLPDDENRQRQAANKRLVEGTLRECHLQPGKFLTNEHLELYYDLERERSDLGYISKGWDDPGFRVGNVIKVPADRLAFIRQELPVLMRFCASRGLAVTIEKADAQVIMDTQGLAAPRRFPASRGVGESWDKLDERPYEFHLDCVIYSDGFNANVLAQIIECLTECVGQLQKSLKC